MKTFITTVVVDDRTAKIYEDGQIYAIFIIQEDGSEEFVDECLVENGLDRAKFWAKKNLETINAG
jgi:hypothetical protein